MEDIETFVGDSVKKNGDLMEGYKAARDPATWEAEHEANPPAAKKRKTKSKSKKREDGDEEDELAADDGEEDAEEEGEEGEEGEEKSGKKRKRVESKASKAKPKAAKAPAAKNGKKGGKTKKSRAAVESEDDAAEGGDPEVEGEEGGEEDEERAAKKVKVDADGASKLESDPEALKVREWRHKLQKTFLSSNKSVPKEDEMPAVDTLFTTVEGYQNMNIDYLTFSKIGKVMRHIHLLEPHRIPRDDEFKFRDRAKALVDKWHQILNANKAPEGSSAAVTEGTARMDLNGTAEGDLTVMDVAMEEA
ncbi:hypothetical protein B0H10DRAFT_2217266 [Mycena sp. CBHHK59/15]|nr:hypothetical protein B0H10DRAFT_2217266 [Mycena sp. CBHHK59/15]